MLYARAKLIDSYQAFRQKTLDALLRKIQTRNPNLEGQMQQILLRLFNEEIRKGDTYNALMGGSLAIDFGFIKGQEANYVEPVITLWSSQIKTLSKEAFGWRAGSIMGRVRIGFIDTNLQPWMTIMGHSVYSSNGYMVTWLKWLLTQGDSIVIDDYHEKKGNYLRSDRSRSGGAIMEKGGAWQVDSVYAGTEQDNWITKVLQIVGDRLISEFKAIVK
jgi:hypothetical protein